MNLTVNKRSTFSWILLVFLPAIFIFPHSLANSCYLTTSDNLIFTSRLNKNIGETQREQVLLDLTFDESQGNLTYDTENDFVGVLNEVNWTAGISGSGVCFNSSRSFISIPKFSALAGVTKGTLAVWIHRTNMGEQTIISQFDYFHESTFQLCFTENESQFITFRLGHSLQVTTESNAVELNKWHHIAVTFDVTEGFIRVYVDGSRVNSYHGRGEYDITAFPNSTLPFIIGKNLFHEDPFQGKIDEVKIYNWELTELEIQYLVSLEPIPILTNSFLNEPSSVLERVFIIVVFMLLITGLFIILRRKKHKL